MLHELVRVVYVMHISFMRPEQQKTMLHLCASCTRTDVALNNLVIRSRTLTSTGYAFHIATSAQDDQIDQGHWQPGDQEEENF